MTTTIFSWGYYGWGNHTPDLIEAVDAVEKDRGFNPPVFVDIRIRRSVRAAGFNGASFEKLLGEMRYLWMKSLGNEKILTGEGPAIQISKPGTVKDLLRLAQSNGKENRRLVYFCGCQWPRCDGKINCHRITVTQLLLRAAKAERNSVRVMEWPGGKPRHVHLDVTPDVFRAVRKGRTTIPLCDNVADAELFGLPWCSVATLRSGGEFIHRIVGPAIRQKEQWCLRVLWMFSDPEVSIIEYKEKSAKLRREWGLDPTTA